MSALPRPLLWCRGKLRACVPSLCNCSVKRQYRPTVGHEHDVDYSLRYSSLVWFHTGPARHSTVYGTVGTAPRVVYICGYFYSAQSATEDDTLHYSVALLQVTSYTCTGPSFIVACTANTFTSILTAKYRANNRRTHARASHCKNKSSDAVYVLALGHRHRLAEICRTRPTALRRRDINRINVFLTKATLNVDC